MSSIEVFVDQSVLSDYCRPYAENHEDAKTVLDEVTVRLITSDDIKDEFSSLMKQRQDVYTKFFEEIPKYFNDLHEPTPAELEVTTEKLFDRDHFNQLMEYDLTETVGDDLETLKDDFQGMTPHEFLRQIDDIQQRAGSMESAITKLSDTVPCIVHTTIEPYIGSLFDGPSPSRNVGHAVYYLQSVS